MLRASLLVVSTSILFAALPDPVAPDPNGKRPIEAVESVFLEDLTWMEVRDLMQGGVDTIVVATGGIEQNGPYIVAGKHNYVLKGTTEAIAKKLGKALVAPIVAFVPEGGIDPPTSHMKYPSTISVTEETFQRLLTEICASFKTHGFKRIVLIGDSGGNQAGMKAVAEKLNVAWSGKPRVVFVPEYYNNGLAAWVKQQGINEQPEGLHDDFAMSAQLLAVDPRTIRMEQRIKAGNFRINGIELAPADKTIEWGRKIIDHRAEQTVQAIRKHESQAK